MSECIRIKCKSCYNTQYIWEKSGEMTFGPNCKLCGTKGWEHFFQFSENQQEEKTNKSYIRVVETSDEIGNYVQLDLPRGTVIKVEVMS